MVGKNYRMSNTQLDKEDFIEFATHFKTTHAESEYNHEIVTLLLKKFYQMQDSDKLHVLLHGVEVRDLITSTELELDNIEKENKMEMIRLKSWIIKTIIMTMLAIVGVGLLYASVSSKSGVYSSMNTILGNIANLYELLFK